jgi:hypothetical protein
LFEDVLHILEESSGFELSRGGLDFGFYPFVGVKDESLSGRHFE